ncbi:MAG: hypothetical protein QM647_10700 [Asticcacaulis sp.]|uniref:hypothetical protein n=1 Tax=Asticcacaulis sp. TaxID=1872648 RepID=UPI0039E5C4A4
MKFVLRNATAAILLVAFLIAPSAHAEDWLKAETAHFTLYSNASEKKTRGYAKKLEAFRTLTNMLLGASDNGPQTRFTLYILAKDDQMLSVRPEFARQVGGVYFNCIEGTQAYSAVQNTSGAAQDWNLVVLFHEYSHYVMFQHARTYYPAWYVEGFAEYLSTADPENDTITIGEMSEGRSYTLAEDRWISFNRVLDPGFGFAGDKNNNSWEIESFYAQSWLLTHYMLSDDKRAQNLNAYFKRLREGEAPVAAFEAATGIKVSSLKTILQRYAQKTFYLKVPVTDYPDSQLVVTPVPAADSAYLLDASLLTTCPVDTQGKAILSRLQTHLTAQASPELRLAVAHAQILYGDVRAAETGLKALVDSAPDSFEANYLLGRAYLKEAEGKSGDDANALIDQARASFVTAYRLKKMDAPNLYFLARSFSSKPGFPDMNVVNAANGAHVLAPGVLEYAGLAAFADLVNDRRDDAVAALEPFVGDPHNRAQAERIKNTVDAITAGKPTAEVMKIMNDNSSPPESSGAK